jgi:integrase
VPAFSFENLGNRTIRVVDLLGLVRVDYEIRQLRSARCAVISMGHVARVLGRLLASDLEAEHISGYIRTRRKDGAAEATIQREMAMLRRGYRLATKQRRIQSHLVPDFPSIDRSRLKVRQGFLTEAQVQRVCRHLDQDVADLVEFLFASAWRLGEARELSWDWVAEEEGVIRLPRSKNGRSRTLPIAGEVEEVLRRRRARELGGYVFHRRGSQIISVNHQWASACAKAGLAGKLVHDLRRSAIKRMMEMGANQGDAMAISGHLTTNVFLRYQIVDVGRQREILERVAGKRFPARSEARPPPRLRDWG